MICNFDTSLKSCHLGNTDTRDYSCSTDGPRTNTHFNTVCTRLYKIHSSLSCGNITRNHRKLRETAFYPANRIKNSFRMTMCRIDNNNINTSLTQFFSIFFNSRTDAHGCTNKQTTKLIFCRKRVFFNLFKILYGNQSFQRTFFIHNQQFFDTMFME